MHMRERNSPEKNNKKESLEKRIREMRKNKNKNRRQESMQYNLHAKRIKTGEVTP